MLPNIPAKVNKNSGECRQIFRGMSSNVPGNVFKYFVDVFKYSGKCPQTFRGMSKNIPGNVAKYFKEFRQTLRGMSVLLKEMRMQGQSKISSCYFCVWRKSRELEGRGSLKLLCVTQ